MSRRIGWLSRTSDRKNSDDSSRIAVISVSVHHGLSMGSSQIREPTCWKPSHWAAKLVPRVSAFGSASIRSTCASRTAGSLSSPRRAKARSSASGIEDHRK